MAERAAYPLPTDGSSFPAMNEYQAVILKLTRHVQEDEDADREPQDQLAGILVLRHRYLTVHP